MFGDALVGLHGVLVQSDIFENAWGELAAADEFIDIALKVMDGPTKKRFVEAVKKQGYGDATIADPTMCDAGLARAGVQNDGLQPQARHGKLDAGRGTQIHTDGIGRIDRCLQMMMGDGAHAAPPTFPIRPPRPCQR
ncbi:MAG: hypothetical protein QM741_18375 [Rudaea sp.]|uniref:hypothetical protein n=1 Tax=Rudaea sp. TaxID=2136325 RepID=UPI0039E6F6BE